VEKKEKILISEKNCGFRMGTLDWCHTWGKRSSPEQRGTTTRPCTIPDVVSGQGIWTRGKKSIDEEGVSVTPPVAGPQRKGIVISRGRTVKGIF